MKDNNTMGPIEFVFYHLWWSAVLSISSHRLLLFPLFGATYYEARTLFLWSLGLSLLVGMLLTGSRRRNGLSIYVNVLLPFAVFFDLMFASVFPGTVWISAAAAVMLALAYGGAVLRNFLHDRRKASIAISSRRCIGRTLLNMRTIAVVVLSIGFISGYLKVLLDEPMLSGERYAKPPEDSMIVADHMDTLLRLREDSWAQMDVRERLGLLTQVSGIEAERLGIEPVDVCADPMEWQKLGSYEHTRRKVTLNLQRLVEEDAHTMLRVLTHEMYHAYQHALVEMYERLEEDDRALRLFRETAIYRAEFSDYEDGMENFFAYYHQDCEQDSEAYAEKTVAEYYERIATNLFWRFHPPEEVYGG